MDTGGDGVSVDAHNLIANLSVVIGLGETDTFTINTSAFIFTAPKTAINFCETDKVKRFIDLKRHYFLDFNSCLPATFRFTSHIQCKFDIKI